MNLKITVILAFTIMSFNCSAQPGHVAADEAKHLYDRVFNQPRQHHGRVGFAG